MGSDCSQIPICALVARIRNSSNMISKLAVFSFHFCAFTSRALLHRSCLHFMFSHSVEMWGSSDPLCVWTKVVQIVLQLVKKLPAFYGTHLCLGLPSVFFLVSLSNPCMLLSFPPYVPHTLPMSFFVILLCK